MAADVAEQPLAQHADHEPSPSKGRSRKKLLIGGIVLVVVAVQVVATYLLMPHPAASSEAGGHAQHEEKEHAPAASHEHGPEALEGEVAEVSLGDFSFSNTTAAPGVIIHVDFKLAAVTSSKLASSLEAQVKLNLFRIRQVVNRIIRSSHTDDLNDPNLGTIKRLIKEDINRLLTKTFINEVVITDVRVMEQ